MNEPEAAVAIVHARGPEESVLLIRRTERDEDPWSGQWSFPGGRRDPEDQDLVSTALRELAEECGIRLGREHLEAALPPANAGRRLVRIINVAPFLFRTDGILPTVLDAEEAAAAAWIPLSILRDPSRHYLTCVARLPGDMVFPAIQLDGVPLWGFTYRVLARWLGLHDPDWRSAAFRTADVLLEFLLQQGLGLRYGWQDRNNRDCRVKVASVRGPIPISAVQSRVSIPQQNIPAINSIEVRADLIRVVGLDLDEYWIESSGSDQPLQNSIHSKLLDTEERSMK